jgi:predicted O-methyltransferase YrrM
VTYQSGLPAYNDARRFPPRVWAAVELTRSRRFAKACTPEVGKLLQLCATLSGVEKACELGTAYGVGAAWIESGLRPGSSLVTVELDRERAADAKTMFAGSDSVEVVSGDWSLARDWAPFDLLFSDGGPKRAPGDPEKLAALVRAGGLVVLDDYTPSHADKKDPARRLWLESSLYRARELLVAPDAAVILAVRL